MASFRHVESGLASVFELYRGSCLLGHAGGRGLTLPAARVLVFGVLARRSLASWSSGVVSRFVAVLRPRLGFLSAGTGYFGFLS